MTVGAKCSTELSAEGSGLLFPCWCVRRRAHAPEFAPRYALLAPTTGQVWTYSAQMKRTGQPRCAKSSQPSANIHQVYIIYSNRMIQSHNLRPELRAVEVTRRAMPRRSSAPPPSLGSRSSRIQPRLYLGANSSSRENVSTAGFPLGLSPAEEAQRSEVALHPVNDFLQQIYQVGDLGFFSVQISTSTRCLQRSLRDPIRISTPSLLLTA